MEDDIPRWEYGTYQGSMSGRGKFQVSDGNSLEKPAMLSQLGKEGWEGYGIDSCGSLPNIYMKRKIAHSQRKSSDYDYGR